MFFYMGRTDMALDDLTGAQTALESAIKLDPDDADAYYFAGQAFSKQGKQGQAHYSLGIFYEKKGQFKNAVFHLQKALDTTVMPSKKEEIEKRLEKNRRAQARAKREALKKTQ